MFTRHYAYHTTIFWFDQRPVSAIHLVVETTCVTQIVASSVPPPERSGCSTTVDTFSTDLASDTIQRTHFWSTVRWILLCASLKYFKSNLGDMLVMVLGIWSTGTGEETVIDRALSDNDGSSGSGEDDSSTGELLESSVSSTSSGGGNGKGSPGNMGDC